MTRRVACSAGNAAKAFRQIAAVLLICAACAAPAAAQESLQTVKDLYASASYEEALVLLNRLRREPPQPELEQYRVFCLIALGRQDEAQKAIEMLLRADPLFVPDPAETSPRLQERFKQSRQQLMPELTRRMYSDARAALDRKERGEAIARFERLLAVIDREGAKGSLSEMRVLALGFLDLSRALAEPKPEPPPAAAIAPSTAPATAVVASGGSTSGVSGAPAPDASRARAPLVSGSPSRAPSGTPGPAASGTPGPAVGAGTPAGASETRPIALKQQLPSWVPPDSLSRRMEFTGAVQVHIGADGRVESAEMLRRVHPSYDVALLRAARAWLYEPATRNGVPIASDLIVEVHLRPPQ